MVSRSSFSANQVQQREQVNPDQIDQMPVESHQIHGRVVIAIELPGFGLEEHPCDRGHSTQNVNTVQSGHHEVEAEKHKLIRHRITHVVIEASRKQPFMELVFVFEILHAKEDRGARKGDQKIDQRLSALLGLGAMHTHYHGETADQQHNRVQKPEVLVQVVMRLHE